jgi:putative membrane protein
MFHPYGDTFYWVSAITKLAIVVLLIVGVVLIVRYLSQRYPAGSFRGPGALPPGGAQSGAMQILEERFARGEIDEDEFRSRKDALRS